MGNQIYDNRELSWLKFNQRVLEEAKDKTVPILERLNFIAIFQSNLDEFFMIRVGSLYDQNILDKNGRENKTNMTSAEQLSAIYKKVGELIPKKDKLYNDVMKELKSEGIQISDFKSLNKTELEFINNYFNREIMPLISPQIIDRRHPFPFLKNKDIYAVFRLETKTTYKIGIIPASGLFSRVINIPSDENKYMLVEDIILHYGSKIFEHYHILEKALMRITRNADINAQEALYDEDVDFRHQMEDLIKKRKKLCPVRLELSKQLSDTAIDYLCENLSLAKSQIFINKSPLDISFVYTMMDTLKDRTELLNKPLIPQVPSFINENESMIRQIQRRDILLCYPYDSIKPFIKLLNEASNDPKVASIKITLYRVARDSKIIEALINAAENGKGVLVLVELRARFDEENNIGWSKRLEDAGCNVIYGPENLKVHSKLLLITRKNGMKVEYITQIGTGNYNEKTSTLYTDYSLMTARNDIGIEASIVFNALSMGNLVDNTHHLLVAPLCLQPKLVEMIDYEIETAKSGKTAYIGLKLNSLSDKVLIDKLIEASQAGVKIELLVRGICCLIAGVEGYTENIKISSIVGRYLEHSRIYIFGTPERQKVYISSADFMTRNTLRRIEVAAPVYDTNIQNKIISMFKIMLRDNVKLRIQNSDGTYSKRSDERVPLDTQIYFYEKAYESAAKISSSNLAKTKIGSSNPILKALSNMKSKFDKNI